MGKSRSQGRSANGVASYSMLCSAQCISRAIFLNDQTMAAAALWLEQITRLSEFSEI